MIFLIDESEKFSIQRINILGNNITEEKVIRNQFEVDEGDFYNEILYQNQLITLNHLTLKL